MGRITAKWGKFKIELPVEFVLFLLFWTFLLLRSLKR